MSLATKNGSNKTGTATIQHKITVRQLFWTCIIGCAISTAALILFFVNPAAVPLYPGCPILKITGWYCPGCGGIRALHALTHGRVMAAMGYNAFLLVFLPGLLFALLAHAKGFTRFVAVPTLILLGILGILFAIARNSGIPPFDILAP